MVLKPLTSSQKKVIYHTALALVVADMEEQVIKPMTLKEGKPFEKGDFSKIYFKKVPQVAQAQRALKKAIEQAQKDIAASMKRKGDQDD
ncbi:hypothetical protein L2755_02215 [Shewanella abyssi]|uniref:hypothetical protein n=1 Tax=Shewanella abyssi TaxID=311789 RepID=UPI00200F645B|nr:hypothetical protein [Shewanella abyssi]MCL1048448.1 hypothetical protein [Shewanella abyssi]